MFFVSSCRLAATARDLRTGGQSQDKSLLYLLGILIHGSINQGSGRTGADAGRYRPGWSRCRRGRLQALAVAFDGPRFAAAARADGTEGTGHYAHPAADAALPAIMVGDDALVRGVHGIGDAGVNAGGVSAVPAV